VIGDRSETWCQRGVGSDRHVIAIVADLGGDVILCWGYNLESRLAVRVRYRTLGVAVIRFVLSTSSVFDVMAIAFFALHDLMDGARGAILMIVIEVTSKFSLFALAVALVDVAAGAATVPVLVEIGV
jgi:hypothetical protein